jgi:hypothetical protein
MTRTVATDAVDAIKGTSAWGAVVAASSLAGALRFDGQYEESLVLFRSCFDAKRANKGTRINTIATAAGARVALGRFDDVLEIIETDLGPMLDAERRLQLRAQLVGLAFVPARVDDSLSLGRLGGNALHLTPSVYDGLRHM